MLAAARSAFAAGGYAGASLADIAGRLGITKASLLHHFPSKDVLYTEVLSDVLQGLGALLPHPDAPFLPALDALGGAVTDWLAARPEAARLLLREVVGGGPYAQGPGLEAMQAALRAVAAFLETGIRAGAIAPQDPMQLAMSIVSIHLTWFASPEVTRIAAGRDPFEPEAVAARRAAVVTQVRRLCGAPG